MSWRIVFTRQAQKDARKLAAAGLRQNAEELLSILTKNPYQFPPHYEKLVGDLAGAYSHRINIQRTNPIQNCKGVCGGFGMEAAEAIFNRVVGVATI